MKVSVCIITYQHRHFIAQAIESALMQETSFDYEILIGEDGSDDGTREIVLDYRDRHPEKIRVFLHDYPPDHVRKNGRKNFLHNLQNARGDYIALLDGDDYWTSSSKLQKQADFLDAGAGFSSCFHNVLVVHEAEGVPDKLFHRRRLKSVFTLQDVLTSAYVFIPTCSVMFRRGLWEVPGWFREVPMADWPLHVLNAVHGPIGYLDEVMGAYRVHGGGIWSRLKSVAAHHQAMEACDMVDRHFDFRYHRELSLRKALRQAGVAGVRAREGRYRDALREAAAALYLSPASWKLHRRILTSVILKGLFKGFSRRRSRRK